MLAACALECLRGIRSVSDLKSYTCAECGAVLSVDKLQGQFVCPFCGAEFNSVYFHRDELIKQADECLLRGAYDAAREKYDAVLANNKCDLDAIRGQILIAGKIHSLKDLNNSGNLLRGDLEAIMNITSSCKDSLSKEDALYVKKLAGLFAKASDIKTQEEKIDMALKQEREIRNEMRKHVPYSGDALAGCGIFFALAIITLLLVAAFMHSEGGFLAGIAVFFVGIIIVSLVATFKDKNKVDVVEYSALAESSAKLKDRLNEMEEEYNADLNFVLRYGKPVKTGAEKPVKKEIKNPSGADTAGAVICAKCGGILTLNAEKQLYECGYCGVSYGKVMFLGDLIQNAKKAIGSDGFDEADQILAHKLRLDPGDSEALLGRFLCAGNWKSLCNINLSDRTFYFHVARLTERLEKLENSISAEDLPDWPELKKLADLLNEYAVIRKESDKMEDKHKSFEGKINDRTLTNYEKHKMLKEMSRLSTDVTAYLDEKTRLFTITAEQLNLLRERFKDSAFLNS